jgi:hypothetical protein
VTITIRPDDHIDVLGTDRAAASVVRGIQNFIKRRPIGLIDEELQQVFLQRLMCGSCSLP